ALSGPAYFHDMYHLEEFKYWYGDYNHNLDAAGVWATQGPLGVSGPLGTLGPLGPLGVSLQFGMTTTPDGEYKTCSLDSAISCEDLVTVRSLQPARYTQDASEYRQYGLYEMYSRNFALTHMASDCEERGVAWCVGDTSFAVDSSQALLETERATSTDDTHNTTDIKTGTGSRRSASALGGVTRGATGTHCDVEDVFYFFSGAADQHVQVNVVPFGGKIGDNATTTSAGNYGGWLRGRERVGSDDENTSGMISWTDGLDLYVDLTCAYGDSSGPVHLASASSRILPFNPALPAASQIQTSIMPFLSVRLRPAERCAVTVQASLLPHSLTASPSGKDAVVGGWTGYYLFVTGTDVTVCGGSEDSDCEANPDIWGPRRQSNGTSNFNVHGAHQRWIKG
ncbi:unnamed protein product, partial [Symbiodinium microadriaticum]